MSASYINPQEGLVAPDQSLVAKENRAGSGKDKDINIIGLQAMIPS